MTLPEIIRNYKAGLVSTSELRSALAGYVQPSASMPLSEGQKGLWMLQKLNPELSAYNVPICFKVSPKLNIELFQAACRLTMQQHPVLTHIIMEKDGQSSQIAMPGLEPGFAVGDLSGYTEREIIRFLRDRSKTPFSLQDGPLLKAEVYSVDNESQIVLFIIHHIVFDGSSLPLFLKTLLDSYLALVQGNDPIRSPHSASYGDFVAWESDMLQSESGKYHREYWQSQLAEPLPILELPTDHPRYGNHGITGKTHTCKLSGNLSGKIKNFALEKKVNRSIVFLAIYKILLYRFTGQTDIIVGMPTLGRPDDRFDELIGYFINMIAIRSRNIADLSFNALLEELLMTVVDGLDHAVYPFPVLVRELNVSRTQNQSPAFQVTFSYQNFIQSGSVEQFRAQYHDFLHLEFLEDIHQEGEYELNLEIFEEGDSFRLNFKYDPDLFDDQTIQRMADCYVQLAGEVIANPSLKPGGYSILSKEESYKVLIEWNTTRKEYPNDRCVHELVAKQALSRPDQIAVETDDQKLTFAELNAKANQLAHYLKKLGVKPGNLIGIMVPRSLDLILGLLGILKAGSAYVPLDPNYPEERIDTMLSDCGAPYILLHRSCPVLLSQNQCMPVYLDECWEEIATYDTENPQTEITSDDLAYVTYTSGTTGTPKGVEIRHKSINRLAWHREFHFLNPDNTVLQFAPISFDASTFEIWGALCTGAKLVICPVGNIDLDQLGRIICNHEITVLWLTSALFGQMVENRISSLLSIRYMLAGGDVLLPGHVKKALDSIPGLTLFNGYGPTENTTFTALYKMTSSSVIGSSVPIGKPIDNTQVYILNQHLQPVPIGVQGELYTGGDGLARGYWNNPELTQEKFIDNPFSSLPGSKLYKTGDIVSWQPDGAIIFIGRLDTQVKIRGFRIELSEIENWLSTYPGIENCAVIAKAKGNSKYLIAYYVAKPGIQGIRQPLDHNVLKNWLRTHLPDYMIPSFFAHLNELPVTPNGKTDRKSLAEHDFVLEREPRQCSPIKTEYGAQLLAIWQEVLGQNTISPDDGFFDVGGDSLLAITVADRIQRKIWNGFSVTALFKYPNIRELDAYISSQNIEIPDSTFADRSSMTDLPDIAINSNREEHIDIPLETKRQGDAPQKPEACPDYYKNSLAIVGISCRFPGANDSAKFWRNLKEGKESIRFFSREELLQAGLSEAVINHPNFVPLNSAIEHKDLFDADFFTIPPKDVELMDPQLRLLLMHSWLAIEDAGYTPKTIPNTAVFISASGYSQPGSISNTADRANIIHNADEYVALILAQSGTIPTMISHKVGLRGPSFFIHSNCSSSLSGLYAAAQCLLTGDSEAALVGAANIFPPRNMGYMYQPGLNFSSDGHCRAFDAEADGMIAGEGVAVIVLKRALDAIEAGDHIYALLRGIRLNNDGSDKVGFYAPSVRGQSEVIHKVLNSTGVNPESIGMVEAHGTGTKLGDPIEFNALNEVYRQYSTKKQFCGLGSVKSNIGHLDTAAGLAGCIKVALSLYHGEIPPTVNYKSPNPLIQLGDSPFYVVDHLKKWDENKTPRRAALSSFGLGGTNAHAIFEEYDPVAHHRERLSIKSRTIMATCIPLSARDKECLRIYACKLIHFLESNSAGCLSFENLAYTLQTGRESMSHRVVFLAQDCNELLAKLHSYIDGNTKEDRWLSGEVGSTFRIFEKDPDFRMLLQTWIEKKNISRLAELWVQGLELDWNQLYLDNKPSRISLPTYPFAETVYPLPGNNNGRSMQTPKKNPDIITPVTDGSDLSLIPVWEPVPAKSGSNPHKTGTILVVSFGNGDKLAAAIASHHLQNQHKVTVIQIQIEDHTTEIEKEYWTIDQNDPNGFAACLDKYGYIDSLFFICGLSGNQIGNEIPQNAVDANAPEIQLLRLAKFIKQHNPSEHRMDCFIITQDIYGIGDEPTQYYGGGLTGLTYAMAQSFHQWTVRNIDISSEDLHIPEKQDTLLQSILDEKPSFRGEIIKLKDNTRYEQHLFKTKWLSDSIKPAIRHEGVYVIAGGRGSVGQIITRRLIKKYRAKVIWIGRQPENDPAIAKVKEHNCFYGLQPEYIQADITDFSQLQASVVRINRQWGKIHGAIFSCVVVAYDNSVENTSEAEFRSILEVKTIGSINFYNSFKEQSLDFLCYFSSAQGFSFSGAANLSAYASGITFADAYVNHIRKSSIFPVGIINWGFWLIPKENVAENTFQFSNIGFIEGNEGFNYFEQYTGLLTSGAVGQMLCLRISPAVETVMPLNKKEILAIHSPGNQPALTQVINTLQLPETDMKAFLVSINPDVFDQWMTKLLFHQMCNMGIFQEKREKVTRSVLWQKANVLPKYSRFLSEVLEILHTWKFISIQEDSDSVEVLEDVADADWQSVIDQWHVHRESVLNRSELKMHMQLTESCMMNLPAILRGEAAATAIIFPDASLESVEKVYKNNALTDYFNNIIAVLIESYIRHRLQSDTKTKIRIIEIGAGIGSTSATLFERLKPWSAVIEYCYTDISNAFLLFAQNKYGPHVLCLDCRFWDISKPPTEQGIEAGYYDIVIAANVLHATPDIRQSLRHAKMVLKTNGLLLINEVIVKTTIATLSFGLTDGWWLFNDEQLRIPGSPVLSLDTWGKVLKEEGFRNISCPAQSALYAGQQIIISESDGVIRQKKDTGLSPNTGISQDERVTIYSSIPSVHSETKIPVPASTKYLHEQNIQGKDQNDIVRSVIVKCLSNSLKRPEERIENDTAFSDYGVDSIISVGFVNQVGEMLNIELNPSVIFNYATVKKLADYIMETYRNQLKMQSPPPDIKNLQNQFLSGEISVDAVLEAVQP